MPIPEHAPLVVTTRGGQVECVHYGSIAVVDSNGELLAGVGDPHALNFTRSALKPLQALPFVEDGGMAHWGFGSQELALMCSSHSGEPVHVEIVARMLGCIGAGEGDLQCGCHVPGWYAATGRTPPARKRWSALQHNCSGKHAGFLAYCRMHGEATVARPLRRQLLAPSGGARGTPRPGVDIQRLRDYLEPNSPLQRRVRATVERFVGKDRIAMGIDGCSAPNYALPLSGLARLYGGLALGESPELAALAFAMRRHPDLVSGTARFDLALMQAGRGDWVCKGGADGIQALGIASRGIGIAVRIADGNPRAVRIATLAVLQRLGLFEEVAGTALAPFGETAIKNYRERVVGQVEAVFELPRVNA